jgi:outer membrane protein
MRAGVCIDPVLALSYNSIQPNSRARDPLLTIRKSKPQQAGSTPFGCFHMPGTALFCRRLNSAEITRAIRPIGKIRFLTLPNPVRSPKHRMNRTLIFASALAVSLASSTLAAQAPAAPTKPATPPPAAPAPVVPVATPAMIAVIAFEEAVVSTNEGQKSMQEVQTKYEPKRKQLEAQNTEIENLQKQLQALPANASDEDRAKLSRDIDAKTKQLQLDGQSTQDAFNADEQTAFNTIARKVGGAAVKYAQEHGFTMLLTFPDPRMQQPNQVLWFVPTSDITEAVVNAYNLSSGVAAPAPAAPAPQRRPTTPAPATAPKK